MANPAGEFDELYTTADAAASKAIRSISDNDTEDWKADTREALAAMRSFTDALTVLAHELMKEPPAPVKRPWRDRLRRHRS